MAGLSMGGSLTLWTALQHPEWRASSASTRRRGRRRRRPRHARRDARRPAPSVIPGIGSDIADPDSHEMAYDGAPIRALKDFMESGLAPLSARYGELTVPLLLFTSRQDHLVEPSQSEYLAATTAATSTIAGSSAATTSRRRTSIAT